jgi:hypothetical protein
MNLLAFRALRVFRGKISLLVLFLGVPPLLLPPVTSASFLILLPPSFCHPSPARLLNPSRFQSLPPSLLFCVFVYFVVSLLHVLRAPPREKWTPNSQLFHSPFGIPRAHQTDVFRRQRRKFEAVEENCHGEALSTKNIAVGQGTRFTGGRARGGTGLGTSFLWI